MELCDIRSKGKKRKLKGKVHIEKNDIVISIKGKGDKELGEVGIFSSLEPYMDENQKKIMKQIIKEVYIKKMQEFNKAS